MILRIREVSVAGNSVDHNLSQDFGISSLGMFQRLQNELVHNDSIRRLVVPDIQ